MDRSTLATRAAAGLIGGFAALACLNAIAIAFTVPVPGAGATLRLAHHVFDAAETLGVGAALALLTVGVVRALKLPPWGLACLLFAAAVALVNEALGGYLRLIAPHLGGRFATAAFAALLAVFGLAFASAPFAASACSRVRGLRFVPLLAAAAVFAACQAWLRDDYAALHCLTIFGAVLVAAPILAPFFVGWGRGLVESRRGRVALAALAAFALFGLAAPPPNAVRFELFRQPSAIAPWVLATLVWPAARLHAPVTPPASPWLEDRTGAPAVSPTRPAILPSQAAVVFITIDAVRADVLADPANDARFPNLARMKREGVYFAHASAPGTQTVVSLSAVFSGAYYSERPWEEYGAGKDHFLFPAADPSPRFPSLLSEHGVATANLAGLYFFEDDFGVARGFREQDESARDKHVALGFHLINALIDRLNKPGDGPLFLYTHLLEPHEPYGHGARGTPYEKYLGQIKVVDAQLGRVVLALQKRFGRSWALFVSADHGEAFGDHETFEHAKTLYEELVHVPLLVLSPLFPAHGVDDRVGLIDLGPTFLDLFQVDTPATFEGQSLVPLLSGGPAVLTRPILAESRLRRALTTPDGLKVIDDPLRKTVEVYDLVADPKETRNLFDLEPARSDAGLAELRAFFAVHAWRRDGYEPRYLP